MYKNQLQELAQRSCFNLPSYSCIREGPDHAPRFKAAVNFNGEIFESPTFCTTLRQAEHAAAEVALNVLSRKGTSKALAARVLDETGVYKNLLQETAHRAGLKLPLYTTIRSGPGHVPIFSCTVELAGMSFTGEPSKTKKQAQKNAALTAWSALKNQARSASSSSSSPSSFYSGTSDEQDQVIIARYLATIKVPESNNSQQRVRQTVGSSAPIQRDVISYGDARSLYSLQQKNWSCSHFYPELSLHQTFPRGVSQQQDHLSAHSSLPSALPRPQFFPFIQSILPPDHRYYFPSLGQEPVSLVPEIPPFLYFSNRVVPVPVRRASRVSIQEIEETPQMEEDRLKGDRGSDCWKNNRPLIGPRLSPTEVPNSLVSLNTHSEQRMQERLQEKDEEKSVGSVPNADDSTQLPRNQTEQHNWFCPGFINTRPGTISTDENKFCSQNPDSLNHLQINSRSPNPTMVSSSRYVRGFVPPSFAAPVTIRASAAASTGSLRPQSSNPVIHVPPPPPRIAASIGFSRPRPEGIKNRRGMPSRHCMAPAVHIRSVVPVCSAPPSSTRFPEPNREKRTEDQTGDISAPSSDFSMLRI